MLRVLFIGELTGLLITRLFFNSCTGMVLLSIVLLKFLLRSRFSLLFLDDAEEVHIPVGRNIGQGVGAAPFGFCLVAQPISTVTIARVSIFLILNFLSWRTVAFTFGAVRFRQILPGLQPPFKPVFHKPDSLHLYSNNDISIDQCSNPSQSSGE